MTFPATPRFDVVVVGGGIVGLATAHAVVRSGRSVAVVEREQRLATHQTGNNSNVIHSGLYYAPGGLKARPTSPSPGLTVRSIRVSGLVLPASRRSASQRGKCSSTSIMVMT